LNEEIGKRVLSHIDDNKVIELAKDLIRIPSPQLHEAKLADWVASYMKDLGMEVELQSVQAADIRSKNAIGRIRGKGSGLNLLLLGHLDVVASGLTPPYAEKWTKEPLSPQIDGDWLYGWGAGNMKCGLAAMISAARAVLESSIQLKGDLTVACVMGETYGSMGTRFLLERVGAGNVKADMAIVPERTKLDIVTITIGIAHARLEVEGKMIFRANGENSPIDQMLKVLNAMGPSYKLNPILENWLRFEPHPKLHGFPQIVVAKIESSGDICAINFSVRFVPGQSPATIEADLNRLLANLKEEDPKFKAILKMPPSPAMIAKMPDELSEDEPIVQILAGWHKYITKQKASVGSGRRLGSPADAAPLMRSGIKSVTYGPGLTSIEQDPPDERNSISEMLIATRVLALTATDICTRNR
jgi:acetylornithine deacetylase/succinyl-diaminopimelate desuccinylase-like protein